MTTETPVIVNTIIGDYILPIIAYWTIIDIFLMTCLNSIFVVLGSQLFLKRFVRNLWYKALYDAVAVVAEDGSDADGDVKNIPTGPYVEVCIKPFLVNYKYVPWIVNKKQ